MNQELFPHTQLRHRRVVTGALFFLVIGAALIAEIYAEFHYGELRQKFKPTFTIGAPRPVAIIYTPWGHDDSEQGPTTAAQITNTASSRLGNAMAYEEKTNPNLVPLPNTSTRMRTKEIRKCEKNGRITYQNNPCEETDMVQ